MVLLGILDIVGPVHGYSQFVHDLEMTVWIFQIISYIPPPRSLRGFIGGTCTSPVFGHECRRWWDDASDRIPGCHGLNAKEFRYFCTGQNASEWIGWGSQS